MKKLFVLALCLGLAACQSGVVEKVRYDFGIGERPEGYVATSDRVMERLRQVGDSEMRRLNREGRHGEVLFQDEGGLRGKYYKQVKVYESATALEASAVSQGAAGERGYVGYVEYTYRVMQGARRNTRAEAAAEPASIDTQDTGRETYRYRFTGGGYWDGAAGELTRR